MRDLAAEKFVAEITDGRSGDTHELYYRQPSNEEIAAYQARLVTRRGNKLTMNIHETRLKYGAKILTGFKKGTIGLNGRAISSEEIDPDYYADWKKVLVEKAPDLVCAVAIAAFDGTGLKQEAAEIEAPLEDDIP
ncbi:MAG: hypothetical protein ABFC75_07710 [Rectinema sp.]